MVLNPFTELARAASFLGMGPFTQVTQQALRMNSAVISDTTHSMSARTESMVTHFFAPFVHKLAELTRHAGQPEPPWTSRYAKGSGHIAECVTEQLGYTLWTSCGKVWIFDRSAHGFCDDTAGGFSQCPFWDRVGEWDQLL